MPSSTDAPGPRILIVDDQDSNVRLLEHTLRRAGYTAVTSTTDSRDVAALHEQHHYDLILLDLQMPGLNGYQVMELLRPSRETNPVAILVISADPVQTSSALAAGANGFLSKPFRLTEVVEHLQLLLKTTRMPAPATAAVTDRHALTLPASPISPLSR